MAEISPFGIHIQGVSASEIFINYDDDNGFALMGADRRLPELLAISEEGNLDLNDTTFNKGLAMFMNSK